jgi:hypothetical protein
MKTIRLILLAIAVITEKLCRRHIKAMIYRRLYGGAWHWYNTLFVAFYKRLPGRHPIVLTTLEGY